MANASVPNSDSLQHETATSRDLWVRHLFALASVVVGVVLGYLIWGCSRLATGHAEPWDAASHYYVVCLVGAGFLSTLVYPRSCLCGTLGVYLGQAAYMAVNATPGDPIILPALLSVAIFGMVHVFLGSLIPFVAWKLLNRMRSRTK
jgi:hypothetical protein